MLLQIWLLVNALVYLLLGFLFLFQFETTIGNLDIVPQSGSAAIELIAVYGGLEAGLGILFFLAFFNKKQRLFALQLLTFSYLSFAAGRLIGILNYEVTNTMTIYLFLFEIIGFTVSGLLLKKQPIIS